MGTRTGLLSPLLLIATALALCLVLASAVEQAQRRHHAKKHSEHRRVHHSAKFLPAFIGARPTIPIHQKPLTDAVSDVSSNTFSQVKDHTSDSDGSTFDHRYFVNTLYANGSQIHFLYIEGAYTADNTKIGDETYPMVALAKSVGATLWLLEHRFYGQSRPFVRTYNKNLPYLSSQQAIEDIAAFINAQNTASGESSPKWVVWGAAYGGALALWLRTKYPTLTVGVVASSPLVSLELDNYQYELNLAEALLNNSFACYRGAILAARAIRQEMQYQEGLIRLNSELHLDPGLNETADDYKSFQFVNMELMPLLQYPVQYNHVNKGVFGKNGGIDDLCAIMSNETIKNIDKVYQWANVIFPDIYGSQDANGNWKIGSGYEAFLKVMWDAKYDDDGAELASSTRLWIWQTCHEFGTWTTTDNGRNIFGAEVPNSYWIALCSDVFGGDIHTDNYDIFDLMQVMKNTSSIWDTTKTYNGTNVVITNGGHDPWRTLVPNKTLDASAVIFIADGVGHNADLQPPLDSDPDSLVQARNVINTNVQSWLNAPSSSSNNIQTSSNIVLPTKTEESGSAEPPQLTTWTGEVYREHPDPEYLELIHKNTVPRQGGARPYSALNARQMLVEKQRDRAVHKAQAAKGDALGDMTTDTNLETWYIQQPVDHFDPTNTATFKQRYLVNDRFIQSLTPPVFLFIGGESEIDWEYMSEDFFQWAQWAKDFHARMYVVEHRYYGDSQPFLNTTIASLRWLQTEQVLADLAVFINTMNVKNNDTNPRWILFGGSYAGSLAAAMRVRYPNLTLGAIASSAPIQAQVDFWGYEQWVQGAVDTYGDRDCGEGIRKVLYEFQRKMNSKDGRQDMKFYACYSNNWGEELYVDEKDLQLMYSRYVDLVDVAVQYDDTDHYTLGFVCELFEACSSEVSVGHHSEAEYSYYYYYYDSYYCDYLSTIVLYYVGWPEVTKEGKEEVTEIIKSSMRNASTPLQAIDLSRPLVKPIIEKLAADHKAEMLSHQKVLTPGKFGKSNQAPTSPPAGTNRVIKPDDYDGTGSTDVSTDYNDPSDDYTSNSCEGSNWSGSSGCIDEGDELLEFECYCWYCDFVSYDRHVYYYEQTQLNDPLNFMINDLRAWTYQTCTEWGYMISDNYGRNIFEDTYPVNFLVDQCSDIFSDAFNRSSMENTVRNTNYMYGGQDNYNGTNVMFINGSEDPWHVLSVYGPHLPNNPDTVTAILMSGTSHCEDMYVWREGDKDVVTQTQKAIKSQLSSWVNGSEKKKKKKKKKQQTSTDYSS